MKITADTERSNAVDMFNSASGTWSTAQLSVARRDFSATSVGNVAIFAGGSTGNSSVPSHFEVLLFGLLWVRDACLRHVAWCCLCLRCSSLPFTRATAASVHFNAVDMYNSASVTWSTAQLSVARYGHAAASVGNVAIFAGGQTSNQFFFVC